MKLAFFFVLMLTARVFGESPFETNAKLSNDDLSYNMPSIESLDSIAPVRCRGTLVSDLVLSTYRQGNRIISIHGFTYKVEGSGDPDFPYPEVKFIWRQEQFVMPDGTPATQFRTIFVPKMWFYFQSIGAQTKKAPYFDMVYAMPDGTSD